MRTNIVLIDLENIKPDSIERLKQDHFRFCLFFGASQKRVDIEVMQAVLALMPNVEPIKISGNGPNALDFHIAYYIGKYAVELPDAYFHIVSKDKGFDPLIKHLSDKKIFCSRSTSVKDIQLPKTTEKLTLKERAEQFFELLVLRSQNHPGTITRLRNAVATHFGKQLSDDEISAVIEELQATGNIAVSGQKVTYPERG